VGPRAVLGFMVVRLHNKKLHTVYTSSDVIRVIKSRRMRLVRRVAHIGEMRNAYKILVRKPKT
jgi:hypothetical protein